MPYVILRFQKRKAGSVAACERNNERKEEAGCKVRKDRVMM